MATITVPGMFLTGTHGARPAANAVGIGTLYACSTHALVYQSDGSTWSQWFDGGAATLSAGSNSTRVREVSTAGASSTLWSPYDHAHDGIGTITASSSNTLQRGTVNLRAGSNIVFGLTDSDGDGELDTVTIAGAAAGGGGSSLTVADEGSPLSTAATTLDFVGAGVTASGSGATKTITIAGGGGSFPLGMAAPDKIPASPGSNDQEWEGTADTLPTDWAWVGTTPTFTINSDFPSWLVIERAAGGTTEYKLRKSNFTMAATSGLWVKMGIGVSAAASSQWEWIIYDSSSSNGYGAGVHNGQVWLARDSNAGSLSNRGTLDVGNPRATHMYIGVVRVSNTWATYLSADGLNWQMLQSADTRSFTVDRLEFRWSSDAAGFSSTWLGRASIDWIRYRTDNLFPKP